jgi:hypothetical protein
VCDNQFTALSQYYYDCYFDVVAQRKDLIAASVQHYWENEARSVEPSIVRLPSVLPTVFIR